MYVLALILYLCVCLVGCGRKEFVATEHLDDVILYVDGRELTLDDIAFTILDTETTVQEQAEAYSPEEPVKYWRAHVNGKFINLVAKDGIIKTAIHDEIFYRLAQKDQVTLKDKEIEKIRSEAKDYYKKLSTYQKEALDLQEEDIYKAMEKIGLVEKYEDLFMVENKCNIEDVIVDGPVYDQLLKEHDYRVNLEVWGDVPVGTITIWGNVL